MGHNHHQHMLGCNKGLLHLPPKGFMAVRVGAEEGEGMERFVVPVVYLNHPLFISLLKEAEEEYGFEHKGAITIPCRVDYFRQVQAVIDRDIGISGGGGGEHNHHHHHHHHHFHSLVASRLRKLYLFTVRFNYEKEEFGLYVLALVCLA